MQGSYKRAPIFFRWTPVQLLIFANVLFFAFGNRRLDGLIKFSFTSLDKDFQNVVGGGLRRIGVMEPEIQFGITRYWPPPPFSCLVHVYAEKVVYSPCDFTCCGVCRCCISRLTSGGILFINCRNCSFSCLSFAASSCLLMPPSSLTFSFNPSFSCVR